MAAKIHIHTKYSLLDAIIEPEDLVKKLVKQGDTALCVTEHGNVYSNVEIYKLCKQYGIKYLYGCEMYICNDVTVKSKENKYNHLVVIAKNETGRINLNKLISKSNKYKYYGKPRIDFEMLKQHKEGLIILSACMAGQVQRALMNDDIHLAEKIALTYKSEFGDDYYLEYQSHSEITQQSLNRQIVDLAKRLDIKYVVTTDAHYLNKDDQKYHNIFVQIGQAREVGETYNDCFVQSDSEIMQICQSTTSEENKIALQTTEEIAAKCNVELPLSAPIMPHIEVPIDYKSEIDYLKHLCLQGWYSKKINLKPNKEEYKHRLGYEMDVIEKMGFEGYYLFVWSYANSVKRRGIARGSGGGSLVAYLANIVDIDPIEYGLYFERFIDVGALELLKEGKITKKELKIPDFDLDFGKEDRNKVLQFVINKYGQDRVASLGQFQYIWAKGAIKDIGRVLGIPFDITNAMTAQLDKETINDVIELGLLDKYKNLYPELFEYAQRLAGLPKSFGSHPCGKVASMNDIVYYNAVDINDNGEVILQGDMHTAEDLGLIKADFLGLRTVDIIYDTLDMIGKDYEYIAPHNLKFDDEKIWENFKNGFTSGIFQFESSGMRDTLKKINCSSIEDLSVANALFRPGSIKFIDNYANRKKGIEQFEYLHPDLEKILNNTFGVIVFQEQLIEVGRLAKLSNPDELRKATAKKKADLLDKIKPELYSGLQNRGWTVEQLDKLWESMLDFAKYSFNKCVSGSTTLVKPSVRKTVRNPSVEEMYKITHDLQFAKDNNYLPLRSKYLRTKNYGAALSMFPDGRIRKNTIVDIQESGVRKVYRITTKNGRWIECTDNHKFPTPNGKKKLSELQIGDYLYIMGEYKPIQKNYNFTNGNFKSNIPCKGQKGFQRIKNGESVKFFNFIEQHKSNSDCCESCGRVYNEETRFEAYHKNGDRHNNETDNLMWLCVSCHKKIHYNQLGRTKSYENGIETLLDEIISIEYMREEMTYDVTMDEPAHNFVANNGLITCNSHSSAYALIAYICMYLKTYHSKEFICAWINSVNNDVEKIAECVTEATRLGVPIYLGKYNDCSSNCIVYKNGVMIGTNTIKFCNAELANKLMTISKTKKYNSFIDLLDVLVGNIDNRMLKIITALNFFSDYGENNYLLKVIDLYNGIEETNSATKKKKTILPSLRNAKIIFKNKIDTYTEYGLTEYLIKKYAKKETAAQYREIDNLGLLKELITRIENKPMSIIDYIKFEKEYLGYSTYTNPNMKNYYYIVLDYRTNKDTTKPYFTLRNLQTGEETKTRIKQSFIYRNKPFGNFSILKVEGFDWDFKSKLINGEWQKSDEQEPIVKEYEIIK